MKSYTHPVYAYRRSPDQDAQIGRHPVVVVGAGPVGLVAAIDLASRGVPIVVVDDDDTVSVGSRAICYAKRTLEILDRLGCGEAVVRKGVGWNVGKVFHKQDLVYQFDLLPEVGHRRPAFINLQQYHFEECLVDRLGAIPLADLRWRNKVIGVTPHGDGVQLKIATPDGEFEMGCDWLIAADGARSVVRTVLGVETEGRVFHDRFLIVDIRMHSAVPTERRFWFDPPFHPNHSVLMHRQADDVWRVDFQLGSDADPEDEKQPHNISRRLRAMLGDEARFEIEWASVYTFSCRRMQRFRHGRVLFAGDAAHLVSPFGARGANSGIQDVDNLGWKLKLVIDGSAPERLLDSYDDERVIAADENIRSSTRATDFITPKSNISRIFRDATLALAKRYAFARRLVNSGRLSVPTVLTDSPLNTIDREHFEGTMVPGAAAADAPVKGARSTWFLDYLGREFALVIFGEAVPPGAASALRDSRVGCAIVQVREVSTEPNGNEKTAGLDAHDATIASSDAHQGATTASSDACGMGGRSSASGCLVDSVRSGETITDVEGLLARRYDACPGTCYLFRPDQHVCARWRRFDGDAVRAAIARASANGAADHGYAGARRMDNCSRQHDTRSEASLKTTLDTEPNLPAPDDFYDQLIALHHGLTDEQSALVNAKLILLLANHIGDPVVLRMATAAARQDAA